MSSPILCPQCKSAVHLDAIICPFCKTKLKMGWFKKLILIFFSVIFIHMIYTCNNFEKKAGEVITLPPEIPKAPDYREKVKFDYTWAKGGFGSIAKLNIKIKNGSNIHLKDIPARCDFYSESNTRLHRKEFVIYKNFPTNKTVTISELNIGFIPEFAKSISCELMLGQL